MQILIYVVAAITDLFFLFVPKSLQRKLKSHGEKDDFHDISEIEDRYGTPLDIIELNPMRGRDIFGALLIYDTFIVADGMRIEKADITGITFNNGNINPYQENNYQIVLTLRKGPEKYVHLSTGMDLNWSKETLLRVSNALTAGQRFKGSIVQ